MVSKLWPPSWKYFSASSAFSNERRALVAASNDLQDLCYLSHSGGGELAGSKDLEPSFVFPAAFLPGALHVV